MESCLKNFKVFLFTILFKKNGSDTYQQSSYKSVLDIPCRLLKGTKELPVKDHLPSGKAYLFVNLAST